MARFPGFMQCVGCETVCQRKSPSQKYCPECSNAKQAERQRLWARENKPSPEQSQRNQSFHKERLENVVEAGKARNADHALGLTWICEPPPPLRWIARAVFPFTWALSKNHIYALRYAGHVALRKESKTARESISAWARSVAAQGHVVQAKVWIDILVQKPSHKGDAINVIDLVCDGLKDGLGVDDRWFCIRRLDWQIVKDNPHIIIGVGQEASEHFQACSHCGLILPLTSFGKKKTAKMGVDRACRECRTLGRKITVNTRAKSNEFASAIDEDASPDDR